jgi:hypothetical protein
MPSACRGAGLRTGRPGRLGSAAGRAASLPRVAPVRTQPAMGVPMSQGLCVSRRESIDDLFHADCLQWDRAGSAGSASSWPRATPVRTAPESRRVAGGSASRFGRGSTEPARPVDPGACGGNEERRSQRERALREVAAAARPAPRAAMAAARASEPSSTSGLPPLTPHPAPPWAALQHRRACRPRRGRRRRGQLTGFRADGR